MIDKEVAVLWDDPLYPVLAGMARHSLLHVLVKENLLARFALSLGQSTTGWLVAQYTLNH